MLNTQEWLVLTFQWWWHFFAFETMDIVCPYLVYWFRNSILWNEWNVRSKFANTGFSIPIPVRYVKKVSIPKYCNISPFLTLLLLRVWYQTSPRPLNHKRLYVRMEFISKVILTAVNITSFVHRVNRFCWIVRQVSISISKTSGVTCPNMYNVTLTIKGLAEIRVVGFVMNKVTLRPSNIFIHSWDIRSQSHK